MVGTRQSSCEWRRKNQAGFTLVELLVVIAIIGILISLLLPAVQAAREAARRTQCSNNLKQLGLALHNYHAQLSVFPFGWNEHGTGWSAMLLPMMEQQAVYDQIEFGASWTANGTPNEEICGHVIGAFRCPSMTVAADINDGGIPTRTPVSYRACGSGDAQADVGGNAPNGIGLRGLDMTGTFFGCSNIRFAGVRDGTSNTIAIGESYTDPEFSQDGQALDYWYIGSPQIGPGGAYNCSGTPPNGGEFSEFVGSTGVPMNIRFSASYGGDEKEVAFGSYHPDGAMFAMADGSVHFLSESIDQDVYQGFGTRNGGEVVTLP